MDGFAYGFAMEENKITRLTVQKKNPDRVNVYLDGAFAFGLYQDTAAWLEVGQVLSDEKITELLSADHKREVLVKALEFISYKPRTVRETKQKLREAGFEEELISQTIREIKREGLLNDERYAEQWVEERQRLRPRSSRVLAMELRRKGISDTLIQSAIEDVDDFQSAYEVASNRIYKYEGLSEFDFRRKLGNYLYGKGYSWDVISDVQDKLWEEINDSEE